MISRGQLKGKIWRYLGKTATQPGFYTSEKLDEAIDEALASIAVEMFMSGEGWLTSFQYFDTEDGQIELDLSGNVGLIRQVRYLFGDSYVPLAYDDQENRPTRVRSGTVQIAHRYRLMGNKLIFDPPLASGGEKTLQLEIVSYPKRLGSDGEIIDSQFDVCALEFIKYKVCSILAGSIEKTQITWSALEADWATRLSHVLTRRVLSSTGIRLFD